MPVAVSPVFIGFAGLIYGVVSVIAGAVFVGYAGRVYLVRDGREADKCARQLFGYSIFYLFLLYAVLLFEHSTGLIWSISELGF